MLTGQAVAPAFGVLLFTDMERGLELYGDSHVESRQVLDYVPAPLAGVFAAGEIGSAGGRSSLYEFTCVAGILRAGRRASSSSSGGGGSSSVEASEGSSAESSAQ
jgi:small ligand-binding sensory domain FIST